MFTLHPLRHHDDLDGGHLRLPHYAGEPLPNDGGGCRWRLWRLVGVVEAFALAVPTHGANGTDLNGTVIAMRRAIRKEVALKGIYPQRALNAAGHKRKSRANQWSSKKRNRCLLLHSFVNTYYHYSYTY
jgi:hypothetical protein